MAIQETNFDLPGQIGEPYHGEVGDVYRLEHEIGDLLAVVRTDRISAFDVVLPEPIPNKGQVLNQMSAELLQATRETAPNWFITSPDPNVSIGFRADPFKVEMIMRGYLLGTSWRGYEGGMRDLCGNILPDGMREFQPFESPLLTPTSKAETGHDENLTPDQIIDSGLATSEEYSEMERLAFDLFAHGQAMAAERGLLLADTKYEFGRLATGQIVAIDEVHTPDSSRYFYQEQYEAYLENRTTKRPEQLSKEFVREWLISQGFSGEEGQEPPHLPPDFVSRVSDLYVGLYQKMLGHDFLSYDEDNEGLTLELIQDNIEQSLAVISNNNTYQF